MPEPAGPWLVTIVTLSAEGLSESSLISVKISLDSSDAQSYVYDKLWVKGRNKELRMDHFWPEQLFEQLSMFAEQFNMEWLRKTKQVSQILVPGDTS